MKKLALALALALIALLVWLVCPAGLLRRDNCAPVAQELQLRTLEGRPVPIALSAADPDDDVLTFEIVSGPARGKLSGTGAERLYTPAPGFVGPDAFAYRASDGKAHSSPATVHLSIAPRVRAVWAFGKDIVADLREGSRADRDVPVQVKPLTGVRALAAGSACWVVSSSGQVRSIAWPSDRRPAGAYAMSKLEELREVASVAANDASVLVLKADGSLWAWGANPRGELGIGDARQVAVPAQVAELAGIKQVITRLDHSHALAATGVVWSWGQNELAQLALDDPAEQLKPLKSPGLSDVVCLAASKGAAYAVKRDGSVWAWGADDLDQLGNGAVGQRSATPVRIEGLSDVVALAAYHAVLALKRDGTVWSWGAGYHGECGNGSAARRTTPGPIPGLEAIVAVSVGAEHCLALKKDGTVWAWGSNRYGQLGLPRSTVLQQLTPRQVPGLSAVVQLAAGDNCSLALAVGEDEEKAPPASEDHVVEADAEQHLARVEAAGLRVDIFQAAASGDVEQVSTLVTADPACASAPNPLGLTPLHYAARRGRRDVAILLLDKGANPNAKDKQKGTPLHAAARPGGEALVQLLLSRGAEAEPKDASGWTPLHYAAHHGAPAAAELLLATGAELEGRTTDYSRSPLHLAVLKRHRNMIALLLASGADIDATDVLWSTPLHCAALAGDVDILALLLRKGADTSARDWQGMTALDRALEQGRKDAVELLKKYAGQRKPLDRPRAPKAPLVKPPDTPPGQF